MVLKFIEGLFPRPKVEAYKERLRALGEYERLKSKFGESSIAKSGLKKDSLTIGDLIDVLHLYLEAAEGSTHGVFNPVLQIVGLSITDDHKKKYGKELEKLSRGDIKQEFLDRGSSLYELSVDFLKAINQRQNYLNFFDLSHYPGGIIVAKRFGMSGSYEFVLTNRQSADSGKPILDIFEEVGLPVAGSKELKGK